MLEGTQPILLGDNLAFRVAEGLVKLIVIGELELREDLIYRINTVELDVIVKLARGFCYAFANNRGGSIPPNFGRRCA